MTAWFRWLYTFLPNIFCVRWHSNSSYKSSLLITNFLWTHVTIDDKWYACYLKQPWFCHRSRYIINTSIIVNQGSKHFSHQSIATCVKHNVCYKFYFKWNNTRLDISYLSIRSKIFLNLPLLVGLAPWNNEFLKNNSKNSQLFEPWSNHKSVLPWILFNLIPLLVNEENVTAHFTNHKNIHFFLTADEPF